MLNELWLYVYIGELKIVRERERIERGEIRKERDRDINHRVRVNSV